MYKLHTLGMELYLYKPVFLLEEKLGPTDHLPRRLGGRIEKIHREYLIWGKCATNVVPSFPLDLCEGGVRDHL